MKVLILSITAGEGHNSTAKAIQNELIAQGAACEVLDTYGYINKALRETISRGYLFFSSRTKYFYSKAYRMFEKRHPNRKISANELTSRVLAHKLYKHIVSYDPDVIVCTHIFSCMLVDVLRTRASLPARTVGILTDFVFHPYWEEATHLDRVVIANDLLAMQAYKKGFRDDQLAPIGIPIRTQFASSVPQEEARKQLGIATDRDTLLVMGGSMGYGNLVSTVRALDAIRHDFQLLVVCGNNTEAKVELELLRTRKTMHVFGFVDNVDVMMDAADCIVTKPGGLTTSEALAKRLPMIIVNPIPGQEDRNREFLLNCGTAMAATKTCRLDEVVFQFFSSPERAELMRRSIDRIRKPDATADLCRLVTELAEQK